MIRILVTGGTFDKQYNELSGSLFFQHTHLNEMLRLGRCHAEVFVETLMMIDSLDMTAGDRDRIVEECQTAGRPDRDYARHGHDGRNSERARRRISLRRHKDDRADRRDDPRTPSAVRTDCSILAARSRSCRFCRREFTSQ